MADNYHDGIREARRASAPQGTTWADVSRYREYARGLQPSTLNADQIATMPSLYQNPFSDNLLKKILQEHTNRLTLERFDVADDSVRDFLDQTYTRNALSQVFTDSTRAMLRDGNAVLSVSWVPTDDPDDEYGGNIVVSRERWWDGTSGLWFAYNAYGDAEYVVNEWTGTDRLRYRTVYRKGVIERYRLEGKTWRGYDLPSDEALKATPGFPVTLPGVIPWLRRDGTALHPPFVHLANGSDDDTPYGSSIFAGGALAFQDQINALQHDITAASFRNGNPTTWSKGFPRPKDERGDPVPFRTGPGEHWHSENPNAAFGTVPPGDLSQLRDSYNHKVAALCRNTSTPLHVITGNWPSGEAIFRAERPIVEETKNRGEFVGPGWSTIAHRSTELANAFGSADLDEDALIVTVFGDPELRDLGAVWDVATKASPFVSQRETLRIAQYPPAKVEEILAEKQADAEAASELTQVTLGRGLV